MTMGESDPARWGPTHLVEVSCACPDIEHCRLDLHDVFPDPSQHYGVDLLGADIQRFSDPSLPLATAGTLANLANKRVVQLSIPAISPPVRTLGMFTQSVGIP